MAARADKRLLVTTPDCGRDIPIENILWQLHCVLRPSVGCIGRPLGSAFTTDPTSRPEQREETRRDDDTFTA
jgi:hypothetical protein